MFGLTVPPLRDKKRNLRKV
jgi:hypothetical protein